MNTIHPPSISLDEGINRLFATRPDFVAAYIENAAEGAVDEEGVTIFVGALRRVVKFRGLNKVADQTGMTTESLTHALSDRANMTVDALGRIMNAIGMRLAVVPVEPPVPAPRRRKPAAKPKPKTPRKAPA